MTAIASSFGVYMTLKAISPDAPTIDSSATPNTILPLVTIAVPASTFQFESNGRFSLGGAGVITYTGPNADAIIICNTTWYVSGANGYFNNGIALNDDMLGQTPIGDNVTLREAGYSEEFITSTASASLPTMRKVSLTNGDTIRLTAGFDNTAGSADVELAALQMSIFLVN